MSGLRCHSHLRIVMDIFRFSFNFPSQESSIEWPTFEWCRIPIAHVDIDVDVITDVCMLLSNGLSLPSETGRGLSEHGDASRETLSESSSLNTVPAFARDYKVFVLLSGRKLEMAFECIFNLPFPAKLFRPSSESAFIVLNNDSSESPSIPSQFSAL